MDESGIKMSAMTVNVITLLYFMYQKSVQRKVVATSFPHQANLSSKNQSFDFKRNEK